VVTAAPFRQFPLALISRQCGLASEHNERVDDKLDGEEDQYDRRYTVD
jgi:hypothetical protein